jgi:hypothetical protein
MTKYSTKQKNLNLKDNIINNINIPLTLTIQLDDSETYELIINNPIKIEDVANIVAKLNKLNKLVDYAAGSVGSNNGKLEYEKKQKVLKSTFKGKKRVWCNTREKAVALMILVNFGDDNDRQEFCDYYNVDWINVGKSLYDLRRRYFIKPRETGIIRFPKLGETNKSMRNKLIIPEFNGETKKYDWRKYK